MNAYENSQKFICGVVYPDGSGALAGYFDNSDEDEFMTRQGFYKLTEHIWSLWDDTEARVTSLCSPANLPEKIFWLTEEGQVGRTFNYEESMYEGIPDAGVHGERAKGYGYLNRLRYLYGSLYAIGNSGQVYQRVAEDQWQHMDKGMLQSPITPDRPISKMIDLNDIGGAASNDLYVCGDFRNLFHWDGRIWSKIPLPDTLGHLQEICALSTDEIYICGYNGCLLKGNAIKGFKDVGSEDINAHFLSVHQFNGHLFLASVEGLYVYDGETVQPYTTGLLPELQDAHMLDSADGVLWSFGYKDLAYFNGKTWTRVDHPDNPPIR